MRILLVDDHTIFRQSVATLLGAEPDFEVLPHCGCVAEALWLLQSERPDILILDLDLGGQRRTDLLHAARRSGFAGAAVVLTAGSSLDQERLLLQEGVPCVLRKDVSAETLCRTIREVMRAWTLGIRPASETTRRRQSYGRRALFTNRESEVLRRLIEGSGNKDIAAERDCSESAVKGIVQQLFQKNRRQHAKPTGAAGAGAIWAGRGAQTAARHRLRKESVPLTVCNRTRLLRSMAHTGLPYGRG